MNTRHILENIRKGQRPIVLFGASVAGRKIYNELINRKGGIADKEICFCDNFKQGTEPITGARIIKPEELSANYANAVVCVCIQSASYRKEVCQQLSSLGFTPEQILEYPQLADAVMAEHDGKLTWVDVENTYDWTVNHARIARMSQWLDENDRSIIDLGAGDCYMRQCLRPGVTYIPTDYVARTPEHIKYDFNTDPFPNIHADVCFLGFILHYAEDWKGFLRRVCAAADKKVIIGIGLRVPDSKNVQLGGGALYFSTDEEIVRVAAECGFVLKEKYQDTLGDGKAYNNICLLFTRSNAE